MSRSRRAALGVAAALAILAGGPARLAFAQSALALSSPQLASVRLVIGPRPPRAQTRIVTAYLSALRAGDYQRAFRLLNSAERAYYGNAQNFASIFHADAYRLTGFAVREARGDATLGSVYFVRESAIFRDHAHDVDRTVQATVPLGVVADHGAWRIKDPGHPWRAFASSASAAADGVRVSVKKISFFAHRIEAVVTIANTAPRFVTVLAYGKSILHDSLARPYRIIETRDWSLTDKVLFEGLRLAPDARYTGMLAFACEPLTRAATPFSLTVAPLLFDGADAPFEIDVDGVTAAPAVR